MIAAYDLPDGVQGRVVYVRVQGQEGQFRGVGAYWVQEAP